MAKVINVDKETDNLHLGDVVIPNEPRLQGGKTVLQCGARPGDGWIKIFNTFKRNGYDTFHVLEIHEPNFKWLKEQKNFNLPVIIHGDIRKIDQYKDLLPQYDVVIFWHGIEHLTKQQCIDHLPKVMAKSKLAYITGCPWGKWAQEGIKNNPHEKHLTHWYPKDLVDMDFDEIYTFSPNGIGPDRHNVMYAIKYV